MGIISTFIAVLQMTVKSTEVTLENKWKNILRRDLKRKKKYFREKLIFTS